MRSPAVPAECVRRRRTAVCAAPNSPLLGVSPPGPIPAAPEAVAGHHGRARRQRSTDRSGLVAMLPAARRSEAVVLPKRASRTDFSPKSPAPPRPGAISRVRRSRVAVLVGRQRLPALALGAGIGGREVCLLAVIVTELEDGPRSGGRAVPHSEANHEGGAAQRAKLGHGWPYSLRQQFRATSKLLSDPSMQSKLLSTLSPRSPSHKFSSPSHTRRPRHGCGPASSGTLSSNNV